MTPTTVNMDTMPLRWGHYKIFIIASLGQLIGSALATLIGVVMPLMQLVSHPELSSLHQGLISCLSLVGIMVGSSLIGSWGDKYGYLTLFRLCPLIVIVASLFTFYMDSHLGLAIGLFFMGVGIGGEYSLGSDYISEIMPHKSRLVMVGAAKATAAVGSIISAAVCFLLLKEFNHPHIWHYLFLIIAAIALIMFLLRIRFAQSPGWLLSKGRTDEAEKAIKFFLGNDVVIGDIKEAKTQETTAKQVTMGDMFRKDNLKKTIFSSVPWACEGFGVYGFMIFLPILLMSLGLDNTSASSFQRIINSIEMTTYINIFVLVGFVIGLLLVNRVYHVSSQFWGFIFCSVGIVILWVGYSFHLPLWFAILGFFVFELFLNGGPRLTCFIIPPQIYSVEERGAGVGMATSIGKIGAILAVFIIPNLLAWGGIKLVLIVTIAINIVGALVTVCLGKEILPNDDEQTKPLLRKIRHFRW